MAFNQIATSVSIISTGLKGYQAISLTNFDTSAESVIASGSAVEIANAFFLADGDITPQASTWTAITTANTAYITLTPSGTAGSQIVTAKYSDTTPVWSTSKQGFYLSAASNIRAIAGVYKGGTTAFKNAFYLPNGEFELAHQSLALGAWDMDGDDGVTVVHAIPMENIRSVFVTIRNDAGSGWYDLNRINSENDPVVGGGISSMSDTEIILRRVLNASFDSNAFDATASTVINRGWCTVHFVI